MTPDWVAASPRVWEQLASALERRGLQATGAVVVDGLDRMERHALADLLGRQVLGARCRVDLAGLDARLVERAATTLVEVAGRQVGRPLVDRGAVRAARQRRLAEPAEAAHAWFADAGHAPEPWVAGWLDGLRRDGVLARLRDPRADVLLALEVLAEVERREAPVSRADLAVEVAGSSHALDEGSPLAAVVARALVSRSGAGPPTDAAARRALWEASGILLDSVSVTCLTLGLPLLARGAREEGWRAAAGRGDPVHLSRWDLARSDLTVEARRVLVCENPRVLEATAQRFGGAVPVVCTSGRPAVVVLDVLRRLVDAGSPLDYHGDFDWAGIAIAAQVRAAVGACPWRMEADDYLAAPAGLPLVGTPVEATWSPELSAAMRRRGVAVHEEAVLDRLLDALASR